MAEGCDQSDWDQSAAAWIAALGEHGDYTPRHILDPVICQRIAGRGFVSALDVDCGEGRFCRMMRQHAIATVGTTRHVRCWREPVTSIQGATRVAHSGTLGIGHLQLHEDNI